jgi:hypothetical protein
MLSRYQVLWQVAKEDGTTVTLLQMTIAESSYGAILRTAPDIYQMLEGRRVLGVTVNDLGLISPYARDNGNYQPREVKA